MAKFIDSAEHRDRFPEKEVVSRLIKKERKKKRRDGGSQEAWIQSEF